MIAIPWALRITSRGMPVLGFRVTSLSAWIDWPITTSGGFCARAAFRGRLPRTTHRAAIRSRPGVRIEVLAFSKAAARNKAPSTDRTAGIPAA
ncbi:hypothetical protein HK102_011756, partial [Quaeritorhiza haematococci]